MRSLGRGLLTVLSFTARIAITALSAGAAALGGGSASPMGPPPPPARRDDHRP